MTLVISTPRRTFEISDIYVMILVFCISATITKIVKDTFKKMKERQQAQKILNVRGGGDLTDLGNGLFNDRELDLTILSCIADNESSLLKNKQLKEWIFNLVKKKIQNESLVISPKLIRFMALKLLSNDKTLTVKIGKILLSAKNRARFVARVGTSALLGVFAITFSCFSYAVLLMIISCDSTKDCGYPCKQYFE
jgi:hypothetical protein